MSKTLFAGAIILTLAIFLGMIATFGQSSRNSNLNSNSYEVPAGVQMQEVSVRATSAGTYDKPYVSVKKGVPVKFNFSADSSSGCGRELLMRDFGVDLLSRNGETVSATFLPQKEGKYEFSCSMRMFRGTLEVVP